jgi:hypothetical protein
MRVPRLPRRFRINSLPAWAGVMGAISLPLAYAFNLYFDGYRGIAIALGVSSVWFMAIVTIIWLANGEEEEWDDLGGLPTRTGAKLPRTETRLTMGPPLAPTDQVVTATVGEVTSSASLSPSPSASPSPSPSEESEDASTTSSIGIGFPDQATGVAPTFPPVDRRQS